MPREGAGARKGRSWGRFGHGLPPVSYVACNDIEGRERRYTANAETSMATTNRIHVDPDIMLGKPGIQ